MMKKQQKVNNILNLEVDFDRVNNFKYLLNSYKIHFYKVYKDSLIFEDCIQVSKVNLPVCHLAIIQNIINLYPNKMQVGRL